MNEHSSSFTRDKLIPGLKWFFKSFIWLGLLVLAIDIISKSLIIANKDYIYEQMKQTGQGIILIPNFLAISWTINTGAAFGLSTGNDATAYMINRIVYIVIASLVSAFLIGYYCKKYKKLNKFYKAVIMLILVGALGNLIDRIFYTPDYLYPTSYFGNKYNGVVDWINFFGIWKYNFNIADSAIVIGVIMLIVYLIVLEIRDAKKRRVKFAKTDNVSPIIDNKQDEIKENTTKEKLDNKNE